MAAIIILLIWLCISATIILMGEDKNAEIEARTAHDTTGELAEPMR
ncbi:hypothetical protein [Paracoccus homiensis]|nr:hypothetical protein [Paracoccus homiensis]